MLEFRYVICIKKYKKKRINGKMICYMYGIVVNEIYITGKLEYVGWEGSNFCLIMFFYIILIFNNIVRFYMFLN